MGCLCGPGSLQACRSIQHLGPPRISSRSQLVQASAPSSRHELPRPRIFEHRRHRNMGAARRKNSGADGNVYGSLITSCRDRAAHLRSRAGAGSGTPRPPPPPPPPRPPPRCPAQPPACQMWAARRWRKTGLRVVGAWLASQPCFRGRPHPLPLSEPSRGLTSSNLTP